MAEILLDVGGSGATMRAVSTVTGRKIPLIFDVVLFSSLRYFWFLHAIFIFIFGA